MVAFSELMNHYLREGFDESLTNTLKTRVLMTDQVDVQKVDGGWSVQVIRNGKAFGPVDVCTEDVMCWLYRRTF
jgi:hypothetical protein